MSADYRTFGQSPIPLSKLEQSGAATGQVVEWNGSAWVPYTLPPSPTVPHMEHGSYNFGSLAAGTDASVLVTFGTAYTAAPTVIVGSWFVSGGVFQYYGFNVYAELVTTSNFYILASVPPDSPGAMNAAAMWFAIGT